MQWTLWLICGLTWSNRYNRRPRSCHPSLWCTWYHPEKHCAYWKCQQSCVWDQERSSTRCHSFLSKKKGDFTEAGGEVFGEKFKEELVKKVEADTALSKAVRIVSRSSKVYQNPQNQQKGLFFMTAEPVGTGLHSVRGTTRTKHTTVIKERGSPIKADLTSGKGLCLTGSVTRERQTGQITGTNPNRVRCSTTQPSTSRQNTILLREMAANNTRHLDTRGRPRVQNSLPPPSHLPSFSFSQEEAKAIMEEIKSLLEKGAVQQLQPTDQEGFTSNIYSWFPRARESGDWFWTWWP